MHPAASVMPFECIEAGGMYYARFRAGGRLVRKQLSANLAPTKAKPLGLLGEGIELTRADLVLIRHAVNQRWPVHLIRSTAIVNAILSRLDAIGDRLPQSGPAIRWY